MWKGKDTEIGNKKREKKEREEQKKRVKKKENEKKYRTYSNAPEVEYEYQTFRRYLC